MIAIAEASGPGRQAVAQLYAQAGYGAPIEARDRVMAATLGRQLVGAVRLCSEHGVMVLRGMQVRKGFQRLGTGSRLLEACLPWLDRGVAFCLLHAHLTGFYGTAGFEVIGAGELPAFLVRRMASHLAQGQNVVAMRRS